MAYLQQTTRTARKDYRCAACEVVVEGGVTHFTQTVTYAERRLLVLARADKWKIKAGQKYIDYRGLIDGTAYTLRMRPEMQDMVSKYNWWPEE